MYVMGMLMSVVTRGTGSPKLELWATVKLKMWCGSSSRAVPALYRRSISSPNFSVNICVRGYIHHCCLGTGVRGQRAGAGSFLPPQGPTD